MLDLSVAYNRYKFLGHEYLTWLWFVIENDPDSIGKLETEAVSLQIGNRMVLENKKKNAVESITITGDDAGLEEAMLALRKGSLVTELNLVFKADEQRWQFTVKGEGLQFVAFKTPRTGSVESPEDVEGAVLEKASLCDRAIRCMDQLFKRFMTIRVSEGWTTKVVPLMKEWMHS